jgi:tripartite-type tricarboxylate transporter receptor subunit TctC
MKSVFDSLRRAALACAAFAAIVPAAQAAYPDKPIRIIVPYTAGGATDIVARTLATSMSQTLNATVVVENKAGASGNIGMEAAANAQNDGYTLVMASAGQTIAASYFPKLRYDLRKDFTPVALAVLNQRMLVARKDAPFSTVAELIAYAKKHPGNVSYASFGAGSSAHMAGELFQQHAGVKMLHVPFRGNADAVTALMGEQVDVLFSEISSVVQPVQEKRLKGLGVASKARFAGAASVPTVSEAGLSGFEASGWLGVLAPAGTPEPVVNALNSAIQKALADPAIQAKFEGIGAEPMPGTHRDFARFLAADLDKWKKVVRTAGISAEQQ